MGFTYPIELKDATEPLAEYVKRMEGSQEQLSIRVCLRPCLSLPDMTTMRASR
jgi:hypothetical protein